MSQPKKSFLSSSERNSLKAMHRANRDRRLCDRIKTILLLDNGWTFEKVATALLLDSSTARDFYKLYIDGGQEALLSLNYTGKPRKLDQEQLKLLEAFVEEHTPDSAKAVQQFISAEFSVNYSESATIKILHKLGFSYKKPKLIPGKADPEKQAQFLKELNELKDSLKKEDKLLYMDGVHPQHNAKPAYGWMKKGQDIVLKSNSGRQRININGAVDSESLELAIEVDSTVNAQSTIALFKKLEEKYPSAKDIWVVCDNARYYRSKLVKAFLETSRVKIKFLPPYAPNLNLIERLWRFMNRKIRNNKYYETFGEFRDSVFGFFENLKEYAEELKSLLTPNFRVC